VRAIFWKELGDHFGKRRFNLMLGLVLVGVLWAMFVDKDAMVTGGTGSFYLDLFTTTFGVPISLLSFLSFFGPIIGITLGFDSINSERTQGTLSRILAQPVYRDAVYNGKFLAGIFTLTMVVFSLGSLPSAWRCSDSVFRPAVTRCSDSSDSGSSPSRICHSGWRWP
jgi:ABC-2 type transport system permease protein